MIAFLPVLGALVLAACGDDDEPTSCASPADGCSCADAEENSVCIDGVGLDCIDGRWKEFRGEDGPCFPLLENPEDLDAACFSPFQNLDKAYSDGAEGCACEETPASMAGYCVARAALICEQGKWLSVEDGPCTPVPPITRQACEDNLGKVLLDPGDGSVLGAGCPAPLATVHQIGEGTNITGLCCRPVEVYREECVALGGEVIGDPGDGSVVEAGCPDGRKALGLAVPSIEPDLCCAL